MYTINNINNRMTFQAASDAMAAAGISAQRSKCTQSYLRTEIPLTTSTNQYRIPILVNDTTNGSPNVTEKRLQLQDAFIVGSIHCFLASPASAAAYKAGKFQLYTYPSLAVSFTAAEALSMTALYNGWISLMVGQNTLITAWEMWPHWVTNQTQAAAAGDFDQNDFTTDGGYPNEPGIVHVGSTNIVMNLNLPTAIDALPTNGAYLVVIHRGILAQNVTSVTNS